MIVGSKRSQHGTLRPEWLLIVGGGFFLSEPFEFAIRGQRNDLRGNQIYE